MYQVTIEPARRLLKVRVDGFWTMAIMADYSAELRRQTALLMKAGGCRHVLVDMSDYPIQSNRIAEAHADVLRFAKEALGARAAIVMRSALSKLQATRVAVSTGHQIFAAEEDAVAWLFAEEAAAG